MDEQSISTHLLHRDGVAVLAVGGEIDMSVKSDFIAALIDAIEGAEGTVLVDLGEVRFLDSSGCHCLVLAADLARERGLTYQVTNASDRVSRVLRITGLDEVLGPHVSAS